MVAKHTTMPPARWVYVVGAAVTCLTMWATEFADSADSADSGTEEAGQRRLDLGDYDGSRQKFYDLDHLFLIIASVLVLSLGSHATQRHCACRVERRRVAPSERETFDKERVMVCVCV